MGNGSMQIQNKSNCRVVCFVSTYSNKDGSDAWYTISSQSGDTWIRMGWELVAFKDEDDTRRAGVYAPVNSRIIFHSFDNIVVE